MFTMSVYVEVIVSEPIIIDIHDHELANEKSGVVVNESSTHTNK